MNPEVKQMWLDALRSGEYKQGRGELRTADDEFCCLGVLCDIHSKVTHDIEWGEDELGFFAYDGSEGTLPLSVIEWAELPSENPIVKVEAIAAYNDGDSDMEPHSFEQIADLIEGNL